LAEPEDNSTPSWFGFPITVKDNPGFSRLELIKHLERNKIGTRLLFSGNLVRQPYFSSVKYKISGSLENTDITMKQTFWVGIYPGLGNDQMNYIAEKVEEYFCMQ
jgi:CDP-6-deoxy-D-xylo-4-hexulose-3-dehydrase